MSTSSYREYRIEAYRVLRQAFLVPPPAQREGRKSILRCSLRIAVVASFVVLKDEVNAIEGKCVEGSSILSRVACSSASACTYMLTDKGSCEAETRGRQERHLHWMVLCKQRAKSCCGKTGHECCQHLVRKSRILTWS